MSSFHKAITLLGGLSRLEFGLLLASLAAIVVFDALGIALVLPLVLALVDPASLSTMPWLADGAASLGIVSQSKLAIASCLAIGAVFIAKNLVSALLVRWQFKTLYRVEADIGVQLYERYLSSPWQAVANRNSSELIRNASTSVSHSFLSFIIPALNLAVEGGLTVIILTVLVYSAPQVSGASLLIVALASAGYYWAVKAGLAQVGHDFQIANFELLNHLKQGIGAGREIRILGRRDNFVDEFRQARALYARTQMRRSFLTLLPRYYLETVIVVTGIVAFFLTRDTASTEEIAPVAALAGVAIIRMMTSANRILGAIQQIRIGIEPLNIVYRDLYEPHGGAIAMTYPPDQPVVGPAALDSGSRVASGIVMQSVSFSYGRDTAGLHDVTLSIAWGESIGIVGPSGSGKSTFIDVLLGLLQPQSGQVIVDQGDIRADLSGWRSRIGLVPQSIYLTDDTLRRNIALGLPAKEIDAAAVARSLRISQLDGLVSQLPLGVETVTGELGSALSGGQRQRIGLARALYHNPDVLIMDEATSALDGETEEAIVSSVDALKAEGKTIIVVAHRLSTVKRCDRLVLMDAGRIKAVGPFEEIIQKDASFASLSKPRGASG